MVSMTRPIDNLGRVVIPMEIRKQLNWEPGTKVDICGTENGIQLTTHVEDGPISQVKKLKEILCNVQPSSEISELLDTLEEKIGGLYVKGETGSKSNP